jgi:SHS2 domain-containing protein
VYEFFEHTADLGLRIRCGDLGGLFGQAAHALSSVIVANLDAVQPLREVTYQIQGDRYDELLHDWLAEVLYTFHVDRLLLAQFDVQVQDTGLTATARGEPIDPGRHQIHTEVKAITYHGLRVERNGNGWLAEVIIDI